MWSDFNFHVATLSYGPLLVVGQILKFVRHFAKVITHFPFLTKNHYNFIFEKDLYHNFCDQGPAHINKFNFFLFSSGWLQTVPMS